MRTQPFKVTSLLALLVVTCLTLPSSISASWLSDLTGINIDAARSVGVEPRTVESIAAAVDKELVEKFPESQQLNANPDQLKKLYATLSSLGIPYEVEKLAGKVYIASDYHDLGTIKKNLFGRVRIMISFTDIEAGDPPIIRFVSQERRLRSVNWRESQDAEVIRLSRALVAKIASGVSV